MSDQPNTNEPSSTEPQDPDDKPPTWRGAGGQPVTVVPMGDAATSGRALTVLFDDLQVNLESGDDLLTGVRCTAFAAIANVEPPAMRVRISHDLFGHVFKDADTRITLMADLGGTVQSIVYPYGAAADEQIVRTVEAETELRPGQRYLVTITLSAERRTPTAVVLAGLEGIDMTIEPVPPPQDDEPQDEPTDA